jgi:hypothetical protein
MFRVGEPSMIRILNAGLWTHSQHLHANHFYLLATGPANQLVGPGDFRLDKGGPIWIDVIQVHPMMRVDWLVPFMRCPDVPNERGIGHPDPPMLTIAGHPAWPPLEEFDVYIPELGVKKESFMGGCNVTIGMRQSPLCFPSHDHSEPSQTSQGGNYNTGLIAGMYFIGDRNTPGWQNFPIDEDFDMMLNIPQRSTGVKGLYKPAGEEP